MTVLPDSERLIRILSEHFPGSVSAPCPLLPNLLRRPLISRIKLKAALIVTAASQVESVYPL